MPAIVAPNEGLPDLLLYQLKSAITGVFGWQLGLFVNNVTPDQATTMADLQEPVWPSYSRKLLDRDQWTDPVIVGDKAVSTYTPVPQLWTNDSASPTTVYGIFILDQVAGVLRFVQRFDPGDIRAVVPGQQIGYLPRVTQGTDTLA